jgi:hypothetical protein
MHRTNLLRIGRYIMIWKWLNLRMTHLWWIVVVAHHPRLLRPALRHHVPNYCPIVLVHYHFYLVTCVGSSLNLRVRQSLYDIEPVNWSRTPLCNGTRCCIYET